MTRLSVNLNKIAVLRNSRGGALPSITEAASVCVHAGVDGLTVHPRPDRRHITAEDVAALAAMIPANVEFNIEGNPFAPARVGYPGLLSLVEAARAAQTTLVPDDDGQLTSDHGFDPSRDASALAPLVRAYRDAGTRVSVFVDAGCTRLQPLVDIGVQRIEIYTGPFAAAVTRGDHAAALAACEATAAAALRCGLGVNAGHDLDQRNLPILRAAIPALAEVSIGHALINDALYAGMHATCRAYLALCR